MVRNLLYKKMSLDRGIGAMRTIKLTIILLGMLFSTSLLAGVEPCSDVPRIALRQIDGAEVRLGIINNVLRNYSTHSPSLFSVANDRYEICFVLEAAPPELGFEPYPYFEITPSPSFTGFTLATTADDTRPVLVSGLKIRMQDGMILPSGTAVFRVLTDGQEITFKDIELYNVADGVRIEGGGLVIADGLKISGDVAKSGSCLVLAVAGAQVNGGEISNCAKGIRVESNDVHILKSYIHDNKYGIYIASGIRGTDVRQTIIRANDSGSAVAVDRRLDGIFYAGEGARELEFYDVREGALVSFGRDAGAEYDYGERLPYIKLPEPAVPGSRIEFYVTTDESCRNQACSFLDSGAPFEINSTELASANATQISLPASARNRSLVAVYSSPVFGSTLISRRFLTSSSAPIVAFVVAPFEMPTPGVTGEHGPSEGNEGSFNHDGGSAPEIPAAGSNTADNDDNLDDRESGGTGGASMTDGQTPVPEPFTQGAAVSTSKGCVGQIYRADDGAASILDMSGIGFILSAIFLMAGLRLAGSLKRRKNYRN